jgi:O-antigen/teichoic acid export membrane protein
MLQGVGKVSTPVKLYTVAMIIKIIMNFALVTNVNINITGAATGTLVGYIFVCVVAMYLLVKATQIRPDFLNTVIKPLISAIACGVVAYFTYTLVCDRFNIYLSALLSIMAGAIIYLVFLIVMKTFTAEELSFLKKYKK